MSPSKFLNYHISVNHNLSNMNRMIATNLIIRDAFILTLIWISISSKPIIMNKTTFQMKYWKILTDHFNQYSSSANSLITHLLGLPYSSFSSFSSSSFSRSPPYSPHSPLHSTHGYSWPVRCTLLSGKLKHIFSLISYCLAASCQNYLFI